MTDDPVTRLLGQSRPWRVGDRDRGRRISPGREHSLDIGDVRAQPRVRSRVAFQVLTRRSIAFNRGDVRRMAGSRERHREQPDPRVKIQDSFVRRHGVQHRGHELRQQIPVPLKERLRVAFQISVRGTLPREGRQRIANRRRASDDHGRGSTFSRADPGDRSRRPHLFKCGRRDPRTSGKLEMDGALIRGDVFRDRDRRQSVRRQSIEMARNLLDDRHRRLQQLPCLRSVAELMGPFPIEPHA